MRDVSDNVLLKRAISPVSVGGNSATVSQIIDRKGFDSLAFIIAIGAFADSDATFTVLVEDGDNSGLSDNADVADAELIGTEIAASFAQADANTVKKIGYVGHKRYVRMTVTSANNSGATVFGVVAELANGARPQS